MRLAIFLLFLALSAQAASQEYSIRMRTHGTEYITQGCWDLYSTFSVFGPEHMHVGQVIGIGCSGVTSKQFYIDPPLPDKEQYQVQVSLTPGLSSMHCAVTGHARLGGIGMRVYVYCLDDPDPGWWQSKKRDQ